MTKFTNRAMFFILIVFTGVLYFGYLNVLDLFNPDEPRYVEVAREMVLLKNYLIPHLNGAIYSHKPPLFFAAMAFLFNIFGEFKEWIARLIPALSGFLTVIITYFYAS
jgi:4-amino-4-deoxy-L-arabinose transferase-like glycosyltransferase